MAVDHIHVLGISGSLRKGSYNTALLRAAVTLLPEGMSLEIFDISTIPLYNQDVENLGFPEPVQRFRRAVEAADAVLIATPEYNHSLPGVLKNALDWASRPPNQPFSGKPLAIMGGGGMFGTTRAQYHLRQVAVALNMFPVNVPQVLVTNVKERFDISGNLMEESTRQVIRKLLDALMDLARQFEK